MVEPVLQSHVTGRPNGLLRVVSNEQLDQAQARQDDVDNQARAAAQEAALSRYSGLASYIRTQFQMMVRHRNTTAGWSDRLLSALRTFNGTYEPGKLAEIAKFGGSQVYARLTAAKCRGATSLLRDVYLGPERSWGLEAPADPDIPPEIVQAINQLVSGEIMNLQQAGQPLQPSAVADRTRALLAAAREAAKKKAHEQTDFAEDKLDEILTEGGYYKAFAEVLVDIPLFPFGCIKGPTVKMVQEVTWQGNTPTRVSKPRLFWKRVSPFDLWFTPGVADIEDAQIIERIRLTRADLNDCLDLPGYDHEAIRNVLRFYGTQGLTDDWDSTDASRAVLESRENPVQNMSNLITTLEFHGNVQGKMLLEYGFSAEQIPDELRDYAVQGWLVGPYLIKVQLNPSPRRRHPYYITSFEKVPGTPVGNAIPDLISDLQEVANASLRAVVNNMSIASGPQVVINDDRLSGMENSDELYPWKRWHVTNPTISGSQEDAIKFFQPQSNAQEMLGVFNAFYGLADDVSAIPKYLSGNSPGGGAGRTASGLAMLMGNASKILQTVCANIDRDIVAPNLENLLDMVLLTDKSGLLTGQEQVTAKGVNVAMQKELMRSRQIEFLGATANPIDMQIIGPKGRAAVLRSVASTIGMDGDEIVPSDEKLASQQAQAEAMAQSQGKTGHAMEPPEDAGPPGASGAAQAQGNPPPKPGERSPRANAFQQSPAPPRQ